MPRCPNCNYELVLLEYRRKYKCPRCSRLFLKNEIEVKEFQEFNKRERKKDKEAINGRPQKQAKLTEFEKRERARECQRKFRENNRELYNQQKRIYWASNREHLLEKRRENYQKVKARISAQQKLYRENHKIERKINALRWEQKELAIERLKFEEIKLYKGDLQEPLLTSPLPYLL